MNYQDEGCWTLCAAGFPEPDAGLDEFSNGSFSTTSSDHLRNSSSPEPSGLAATREVVATPSVNRAAGCGRAVTTSPDCLASTSLTTGGEAVAACEEPLKAKQRVSSNQHALMTPGGRRIYPTAFKLKVLDSYRKDVECKGNQRATARKFGIHRRQIQKWLQIEEDLRSSVAMPASDVVVMASRDNNNECLRTDSEEIALDLCVKSSASDAKPQQQVESALINGTRSQFSHHLLSNEDPLLSDSIAEISQTPSPSTSSSGKRRSFTLQFKLDVLHAFYTNNSCKGNQRATARLFRINRRQVQKWLGQEVQLRSEAALNASSDSETCNRRQRLGRWLYNVPKWNQTAAALASHPQSSSNWHEDVKPPMAHLCSNPALRSDLTPPQDEALCLVKVERHGDEDSMDVDPLETPSHDDAPTNLCTNDITELSSSHRQKRHSYPLDFKLQALDAYHADTTCRGNQRAVAERFSIHRRQVQMWLKQETQLRQKREVDKITLRSSNRTPTILKPVPVLSNQHTSSFWPEDIRAPTYCWS